MGSLHRLNITQMPTSEGIKNCCAPKIYKHIKLIIMPMSAGIRIVLLRHYSIKITTKIALITKSSPLESNSSFPPSAAPRVQPITQ